MRFNRLLLLLAIIVPVVACVICLKTLSEINKKTGEVINAGKVNTETVSVVDTTIKEENNQDTEVEISDESEESSAVRALGSPLSTISMDASVAISVANIYKDPEETSEIVGTTVKYDKLKAQKYPKGWSRVMYGSVTGWMRTENITFPETVKLLSDNTVVGKQGTVSADPYLNMRAKASATADKVTTIPDKTTVTIEDVSDGWYKVTYASFTGWVSAEYVVVK